MDDVSLADVIAEISEELLRSQQQRIGEDRPAIFLVDAVDIELSFVVSRSTTGNAGVSLHVLKAGGEKTVADQQVQRVTVHLVGARPDATAGDTGAVHFQPISRSELTPVLPREKFEPHRRDEE